MSTEKPAAQVNQKIRAEIEAIRQRTCRPQAKNPPASWQCPGQLSLFDESEVNS